MINIQLNTAALVNVINVGEEKTPIIIIDDLVINHQELIAFAASGTPFSYTAHDFYPGKRKPIPDHYISQICQHYLPLLTEVYSLKTADNAKSILSAFSLSTTSPDKLRPIQTVPHFDTSMDNQFAIVHYLCGEAHGGTAFYRHISTGFERIHPPRLLQYGGILKNEAIEQQLHLNTHYINSDTVLFKQLHTIPSTMNRAIIYPSNLLHSGNIKSPMDLIDDPLTGRLTVSSFIQVF